jgi:hypothetical protein
MKLLELLDDIKSYARVQRASMRDRFIIRRTDLCSLVLCNADQLLIGPWIPTLEDLLADDWDVC